MDGTALIDLGEIPGHVVAVSPTVGAEPRIGRIIRLGVLVIALLASVGASATLPAEQLEAVGQIPFATSAHVLIEGRHAVVLDNLDGVSHLSAYSMPGGRREWSRTVPGTTFDADVLATATTIIATIPQSIGTENTIEAVDLRTGAVRWQRTANTVQLVTGGLLVYSRSGRIQTVSLVDPVSGAPAWSVNLAANCTAVSVDEVSTRVLMSFCAEGGDLHVFDLRTGVLVARRHIDAEPVRGATGAAVPALRLMYAGAVTLIGTANGPQLSVSAFRTSDLKPLWSGLSRHGGDAPVACGVDLCLGGHGDNVVVVDPSTGQFASALPGPAPSTLKPGALVLVPDVQDYQAMRAGPVPARDAPVPAGVGVPIGAASPGVMWIATPTASSVRLLDYLHGVETFACASVAGYVACPQASSRLTFWRHTAN